jgi:drug/metabolite transporter (DMT)-like permease
MTVNCSRLAACPNAAEYFDARRIIQTRKPVGCPIYNNRASARMTMTNPQRSNHAIEFALLALLATLWGASYTFIKLGVATIPPITLIAARTLIAGLLLLIIMRARGLSLPRDAASWRRFLFQACLNSVVPFTLIAWAERSLDAGLATILNSTAPVFTFLMTFAITRHEPVTARKLFGVLTGLAGTCLIVGVQALGGIGEQLVAQIAVVVATICYAGAAIFSRGFRNLDPMAPAAGSLLCGAAILVPLSLVIDHPWTLTPSASSILALLGLSVFSTALAFVIYFRLIQTLGSVGTTSQAYLRVPIGVAIGVLFLGESLTSTAWIGLGCVVIGVAAMTIPARTGFARRPC